MERPRAKENNRSSFTLTNKQAKIFLHSLADFFPEDNRNRQLLNSTAEDLVNPAHTANQATLSIDPKNPLLSLARLGPVAGRGPSRLGDGKVGRKRAETLTEISHQFEINIVNGPNVNSFTPAFEMKLLLQENNQLIKNFLATDGNLIVFIKRKHLPDEAVDLIYEISRRFSGQRLDWLENYLKTTPNNQEPANLSFLFGPLENGDRKWLKEALERLAGFLQTSFEFIPVTADGQIEENLRRTINQRLQPMENLYSLHLVKKEDTQEEITGLKGAIGGFFPVVGLTALSLKHTPLGRAIPVVAADLLTFWLEISPFVKRTDPPWEKIKRTGEILIKKYSHLVLLSGLIAISGAKVVDYLIKKNQSLLAGFSFGFLPFIHALATTANSTVVDYQKIKQLQKEGLPLFKNLSSQELFLESLSHVWLHPARAWLIVAGVVGVLLGSAVGATELLNNPYLISYVGELNEALISALGIFAFHLRLAELAYKKRASVVINSKE